MAERSNDERPLRSREVDEILDAAVQLEAKAQDHPGLSLVDLKRIGAEIGLQ
jgi:hypothetical protein